MDNDAAALSCFVRILHKKKTLPIRLLEDQAVMILTDPAFEPEGDSYSADLGAF